LKTVYSELKYIERNGCLFVTGMTQAVDLF